MILVAMVTRMKTFEMHNCGYLKIPKSLGICELAFSKHHFFYFDIPSGVFERSTVYNKLISIYL